MNATEEVADASEAGKDDRMEKVGFQSCARYNERVTLTRGVESRWLSSKTNTP